jgi:diaminopimelate epimerase
MSFVVRFSKLHATGNDFLVTKAAGAGGDDVTALEV